MHPWGTSLSTSVTGGPHPQAAWLTEPEARGPARPRTGSCQPLGPQGLGNRTHPRVHGMEEVEGGGPCCPSSGWQGPRCCRLAFRGSPPRFPVWGLSYDSAAPAPGERRQWKDPRWVAGGACVERAEHCCVCEELRRRGLGASPGLDGDWGGG